MKSAKIFLNFVQVRNKNYLYLNQMTSKLFFLYKLFKEKETLKLFTFHEMFKKKTQPMWGRWCLPSFNKHCNQILKSQLADYDNNLCDGKPIQKMSFNESTDKA